MHRIRSLLSVLPAILVGLPAIVGCNDSNSPLENARVSMRDECDPASFNAALGPGTCTRNGSVTFAQFNSELDATQHVTAWTFVPTALTIHVGDVITAMNDGGEEHTFTEVEHFGGGIVPSLNQASGNPDEAPECAQLDADDHVAAGATYRTDPATSAGMELYQCCIHPWMRAVVTVN